MDSEDIFDAIIEYDGDGASENESQPLNRQIRQPKTTKEQFERMAVFMNEHDEKLVDKDTYDLLWNDLAATLNDIGPPDHTASEWRKIWSMHKYNKKRKRVDDSDNDEPSVQLDPPSRSVGVVDQIPREISDKLDGVMRSQSEICANMCVFIQNQNEMMSYQQAIIVELQSSNAFLQEIANKIDRKSALE